MQYVRPATALATVLMAIAPLGLLGQNLTLTNYQLVSRFGTTATYRADLVNTGPALNAVSATAASLNPFSVRVINGQDTLTFQPVPANSTVTSSNTFTVYLADPNAQLNPSQLSWTFSITSGGPIANAGQNVTANVGSKITLDGTKSTTPAGTEPLSYSWTFTSIPQGSSAFLALAGTAMPFFTIDVPGIYVARLTVTNSQGQTSTASVQVSTFSVRPTANAGSDRSVKLNDVVQLDGSGSTDPNNLALTYQWTLIPAAGSSAKLSDPTAVKPTFVADVVGVYKAQLIVKDSAALTSDPATVTITTVGNVPPTVNAGQNQNKLVGETVQLNCVGSDPNTPPLLPLTYKWTFVNPPPAGSTATFSSSTIANPTFVVDKPGNYVAQCTVTNSASLSAAASVTISTGCAAPTANAGPPQNVTAGSVVTLDGSGSGDPCLNPLTFAWSFTARPQNSTATLSDPAAQKPTFVADLPGTYVAQLNVSNGTTTSSSTVTITAGAADGIVFLTNPLTVTGGIVNATLIVQGIAGPGGRVINLVSSNPTLASVPATVTVPAGDSRASVPITPGTMNGTATITATSGALVGSLVVNVSLPQLDLSFDTTNIGLTSTVNGIVTLPAPAIVQTTVTVSATPGGVVTLKPTTVFIAPGNSTGVFTVTGDATGPVTITATSPGYNSIGKNVSVGFIGKILLPVGLTIAPNETAAFPVKLLVGAPADGTTVTLKSSDPSKLTISPSTVFFPFRSTVPTTQPQITGVNLGAANIEATAPGYAGDTQAVQITASLYFSPGTVSIYAGLVPPLFSINVANPAPVGGYSLSLTSSAPGVVSVPSIIQIPQGQTSAQIPLTPGATQGTATLTASAPGVGTATATVNVTVAPIIVNSNMTVAAGSTVAYPVSLSIAAPLGGTTVKLTSSDPTKLTVSPDTLFFPGGSTMSATQAQATGVNIGVATITASSANWTSGTTSVVIPGTLTLTPPSATVKSTQSVSLNVCLSAPAPPTGLNVNLSSENTSVATVQPSVLIVAGQNCVTAAVTGGAIGSTVIHASSLPAVPDTTATVNVQPLGTITLTAPANLVVAQQANIAVLLSAPAPAGGVNVTLSSTNANAVPVQSSVSIPAGSTSVNVPVTAAGVGSATINGSATGWTSGAVTMQVTALTASFTPNSATVTGTQNLSLCLSAPAVVNMNFTIGSSSPAVATVPSSAQIPVGQTCTTVAVTAGNTSGTSTISANAPTLAAATTALITVKVVEPPPTTPPISFIPGAVVLAPGASMKVQVSLANPAAGSTFISLSSSDPDKVTVTPASFMIQQGQSSYPFVTVNGVALGSATITATAFGLTPAALAVQVTNGGGSGGATASFNPSSVSITGTATQNLTLTLSTAAPAGGVTATLTSGSSAVATVPASVFIAAGNTTATVPVTGVAPGSTSVTANVPGYGTATANVSVSQSSSGGLIIPASTTLAPGQTTQFAVNLASAAPSGVFISLSSSDDSKVTISPATAYIPQGATKPGFMPQITGVSAGTVTITANAAGFGTATGQVTVGSTQPMVFSPSDISVVKGKTTTVSLVLPSPAPLGGQVVNLTSDNPNVASVPFSVTVPQFSVNTTVDITGNATGTAKITASANATIGNATANVTVVSSAAIILPSGVTIAPGQTNNFPITLGSPAPAGGVFVNLATSDSNILTLVPTTVFFAGGSTTSSTVPKISGITYGTVNVTATANGLASAVQPVIVGSTVSISPANFTISGINSLAVVTLNLSSAAPPGGVTLNVASSDTTVLTVPATAVIGENSASVSILVKSTGTGTATISASALPNIPVSTASVKVVDLPSVVLPVFQSVGVGGYTDIAVSLSSPAPAGGVNISLSSSSPDKFTVTPTVFVPGGATTPTTMPRIQAGFTIASQGWSTLSAAAPGYKSTSLDILVQDSITIAMPQFPRIGVGTTAQLPIALPGPAPNGGVTVQVSSSDPTRLTVSPTSLFFPGGQNLPSTPLMMTGLAFGTSTVSAVSNMYNSGIQIVTVTTQLTFAPATLTLSGGQSGSLTLSMSGPAPAGGLTVNLGSTAPTIASVPSTVFIPQGSTTVSVPINGTIPGTATINALTNIPGFPSASATVIRN